MQDQIAVDIDNVGKQYQLGHKSLTIRDAFSKKNKTNIQPEHQSFWALKDLSLTVKRGESIGIIGRNGAGKSTLLKILSRITKPTTGRVELYGRISSLLEVGTGFHPELSGLDNIFLNGAILGMTRKEISNKLNDIIEFSGVQQFVRTPVKHFSSGMKVRLAFSVAAHLDPDILIVDEVLAVGDSDFQEKCLGAMDKAVRSGRTVLFVSHNMGAVANLCTRSIVLDQGEMVFEGSTNDAIRYYTEDQKRVKQYIAEDLDEDKTHQVTRVSLHSHQAPRNSFAHDEEIVMAIDFVSRQQQEGLNICISVFNHLQQPIFTSDVSLPTNLSGKNSAVVSIPKRTLKAGNYSFLVAIHDPRRGAGALDFLPYICPMNIFDNGSEFARYEGVWKTGDVFVECNWKFETNND